MLKDEIEKEQYSDVDDVYEGAKMRSVSLEEANLFMALVRNLAVRFAGAVALCILAVIPLVLSAGMAEYSVIGISEDMAGGIGVTVLLILVAIGVAVLILNSMKLEKFDYLEKEELSLQYGVHGIVSKKKEDFAETYRGCVAAGTVLCILAVTPVMIMAGLGAPELYLIYGTSVMFAVLAAGVFLFVWSGYIQGSFQKLLQEGDYTPEKKRVSKKTSFFPGVYWCFVTAVFLSVGFFTDKWKESGLIWPVAALLFVVILGILRALADKKQA